MKLRQTASFYFLLQGVAVIAWWVWLFSVPSARAYFRMGDSDAILLAFCLPDLLFLAVGSLIAAAFCWSDSRFLSIALWWVSGVASYATLYCLSLAVLTDSGWLGVVLMFPVFLWSGVFATALTPSLRTLMFRHSKDADTRWILAKTLIQIIIVWSIILFILPEQIVWLETKLGIAQFVFPKQKSISALLFLSLSLIGVCAAITMARIGRGTPLPMDSASKLVVQGPYSFVRNPMAISGVGQGIAVALYLGSPLVLIYALMGGLIWQLVFRPLEEEDLEKRFGQDYNLYRKGVRCWIPSLNRFSVS